MLAVSNHSMAAQSWDTRVKHMTYAGEQILTRVHDGLWRQLPSL